jgi:hypothetical protein
MSPTGKLFKVMLRRAQRHVDENGLFNVSQFGFCADHRTTFQCMRPTNYVTLNFNNDVSAAAVFLDIEKAFDTLWYPVLLGHAVA